MAFRPSGLLTIPTKKAVIGPGEQRFERLARSFQLLRSVAQLPRQAAESAESVFKVLKPVPAAKSDERVDHQPSLP
jgi:hypothetical protein